MHFTDALLDEGQQQHIYTKEAASLEQATKVAEAYENARMTTHKQKVLFCY